MAVSLPPRRVLVILLAVSSALVAGCQAPDPSPEQRSAALVGSIDPARPADADGFGEPLAVDSTGDKAVTVSTGHGHQPGRQVHLHYLEQGAKGWNTSDTVDVGRTQAQGTGPSADVGGNGDRAIAGVPATVETDGTGGFAGLVHWDGQQARLIANLTPPGPVGPGYGADVHLDTAGDTAVVADPTALVNGTQADGVVHVFERTEDRWRHDQRLTAPNGTLSSGGTFGQATALSQVGTTLAVSGSQPERTDCGGGRDRAEAGGQVLVHVREGGGWSLQARLQPRSLDGCDGFGRHLEHTPSGNHLMASAPFADTGRDQRGAAFVFERQDEAWKQSVRVIADEQVRRGQFVQAIALGPQGSTAFVASYVPSQAQVKGTVKAFPTADGDGPERRFTILEPTDEASGRFGHALALTEDHLLVGAHGSTVDGNQGAGRVFVYEHPAPHDGPWERSRSALVGDRARDRHQGHEPGGQRRADERVPGRVVRLVQHDVEDAHEQLVDEGNHRPKHGRRDEDPRRCAGDMPP